MKYAFNFVERMKILLLSFLVLLDVCVFPLVVLVFCFHYRWRYIVDSVRFSKTNAMINCREKFNIVSHNCNKTVYVIHDDVVIGTMALILIVTLFRADIFL